VSTPEKQWLHDPELVDQLASFEAQQFSGIVWRATRLTQDPLAFSYNGGRWAPPSSIVSTPVLYTSLERHGAIYELSNWMAQLSPRPTKPIIVHQLNVTASAIVTLTPHQLETLGVDMERFEERNYAAMDESPPSRSQEIGAALSFLGINGLRVPSARWQCENLVLFDNQNNQIEIDDVESEEVDWLAFVGMA